MTHFKGLNVTCKSMEQGREEGKSFQGNILLKTKLSKPFNCRALKIDFSFEELGGGGGRERSNN